MAMDLIPEVDEEKICRKPSCLMIKKCHKNAIVFPSNPLVQWFMRRSWIKWIDTEEMGWLPSGKQT
jgi:hypothetical protein